MRSEDVAEPTSDKLVIAVAANDHAKRQFAVTGPLMESYAKRCGADFVVVDDDRYPEWPMWNKYRIGEWLRHYDQTLYMDCDVIVKPDAPSIFAEVPKDRFCVYDEMPDTTRQWCEDRWNDLRVDSPHLPERKIFRGYQAGVMLIPRVHADIYDPPEQFLGREWVGDQLLMSWNLERRPDAVFELDWRWNTVFIAPEFWERLPDSYMIHCAGAGPAEYRVELLQRIAAGNLEYFAPPPGGHLPRWKH